VTPNSAPELKTYADFLNLHKDYSAKIVGYTDSQGSDAYNQKLSQNRANAVVAELKKRGVAATQLSAEGKGEANPVASNMTAEGRAANRRIEAELIKH
jgi:OOP family OmpA-OmpF porin